MARGGNFGRTPRAAPSLTNMLVAIAREMQATRDKNIMDAWKGGGLFEGKKVTDEMVLAHWQTRMDNVSKDDPLWDTYNTAKMQLDYAINESKMTVKYAKGQISDRAMANFYLNWAKKVPQNSEFYRILQRDAAQYLRASKARSAADAKRAKEEAYQRQQAALRKKFSAPAEFLIDTLRIMASVGSPTVRSLIGSNEQDRDLTDFDPTEPDLMLRLMGELAQSAGPSSLSQGAAGPTDRVIYHNPYTGRNVTGKDIVARLKELDPSFTGQLTLESVNSYVAYQMQGIEQRIKLAQDTGHASDVNALTRERDYVAGIGRQMKAWPVQQEYMNAKQEWDRVANDASSSPMVIAKAYEKYRTTLLDLADDERIETDDYTRNALLAEARGDTTAVALSESFTGAVDRVQPQNIAIDQMNIAMAQNAIERVNSGTAVWTRGEYQKDGSFVPSVDGSRIGPGTASDFANLSGDGSVRVMVPQTDGSLLPLHVALQPIKLFATDERGNPAKLDNSNPAATYATVRVGGIDLNVYSYEVNGERVYSSEAPFPPGMLPVNAPDGGLALDVSAQYRSFLSEGNLKVNTDDNTNVPFYVTGAGKFDRATGLPKDGEVRMNPQYAFEALVPERATAGRNPATEFLTPLLAAVAALPDSQRQWSTLSKDREFTRALNDDLFALAGARFGATDPTTGRREVDWSGFDANRFRALQGEAGAVLNKPEVAAADPSVMLRMFDRDKPVSQLAPIATFNRGRDGGLVGERIRLADEKLPGFGPIGAAFQPGTANLVRGGQSLEAFGVTLTTPTDIKVPGVPTNIINPNTGFTVPAPVQVPNASIDTYKPPSSTVQTYQPPKPGAVQTPGYGGEQLYGAGNAL